MLHSLHSTEDLTMLERQRAGLKWLQQQDCGVQKSNSVEFCLMPQFQGLIGNNSVDGGMVGWPKRPEQYLGSNNFPKFANFSTAGTEFAGNRMDFVPPPGVATSSLEMGHCFSRTSSCQMVVAEAVTMEEEVGVVEKDGKDVALAEKMELTTGRDSLNKRKAEFIAAVECKEKRIKGEVLEVESKVNDKNNTETSKEKRGSEIQKPDYIHVRARRGQATDSHSLAERARREKISKKMKFLQDLVPGCDKITGKAGMLDEIINYVQSLQRQVELLSMKISALNPSLEFNGNFSPNQFPAHVASFQTTSMSSAIAKLSSLQLNSEQQAATGCELDRLTHRPEIAPGRTTTSFVSVPELCLDSSYFSQVQPFPTWDADLQSLFTPGFH